MECPGQDTWGTSSFLCQKRKQQKLQEFSEELVSYSLHLVRTARRQSLAMISITEENHLP